MWRLLFCMHNYTTVRAWVPSQSVTAGVTLTSQGRTCWQWSCMSWKWHKPWSDIVGTVRLKLMFCGFSVMNMHCRLTWYNRTNTVVTDRWPELGSRSFTNELCDLGQAVLPWWTLERKWAELDQLNFLKVPRFHGVLWANMTQSTKTSQVFLGLLLFLLIWRSGGERRVYAGLAFWMSNR